MANKISTSICEIVKKTSELDIIYLASNRRFFAGIVHSNHFEKILIAMALGNKYSIMKEEILNITIDNILLDY